MEIVVFHILLNVCSSGVRIGIARRGSIEGLGCELEGAGHDIRRKVIKALITCKDNPLGSIQ